MAIRDILVSIDASAAGEERLRLAIGLAQSHKASLVAAYVMSAAAPPANSVGFGPATPAGTETLGVGAPPDRAPRAAERAEQVELRFQTELRVGGLGGEWHLLEDGDTAEFIELAKTADVAILGQQSSEAKGDGAARLRPDDVVVEIGRPVLVVPYAGRFETIGRRVLVAWDGTREATRAVNDALPLIAGAEAVTVLYVGAQESGLERMRPTLERLVAHLERHDLKARAEDSLKGDMAISDLLLSRAADLDADMLVAGAYHHSQLREALLGGVSRELLRHMTVPVLMSH